MAQSKNNSRTIGIYPETKNPEFFNSILAERDHNTTMEDILLEALKKHGYSGPSSPCFVQSFFPSSLEYIATKSSLPLVYLTSTSLPNSTLEKYAKFCYGVGPSKNAIVQVIDQRVFKKTDFLDRAHAYGLKVSCLRFWRVMIFALASKCCIYNTQGFDEAFETNYSPSYR